MESSSPEEHAAIDEAREPAAVQAGAGEAASELQEAEAEHARLEGLLRDRADALQATRIELGETQALLRDALARFELLPPPLSEPVDQAGLVAERDRAVARAIEAEAARAEVVFRLDEVMGHLAEAARDTTPGLDEEHARLLGRSRGLQAALAEVEEARDVAQARLMLAEADLEDAARASRDLERQLAEAREQLELELLKARALGSARERAALRGERDGLSARADESERAFAAARQRADDAERAAAAAREQLGATRAELAEATMQRAVLESRLADAEREREGGAERSRDIAAELAAVQASLGERSDTLERLEAELLSLRDIRGELEREQAEGAERLRAEREAGRRVHAADQLRLRELSEGLSETRELLSALSADVRDALGSLPEVAADGESEATLPGVPLHIEAVEALEEQVAEREQRIRQLQGKLTEAVQAHATADEQRSEALEQSRAENARLSETLERADTRQRAVEASLRSLRDALEPDSALATRVDELLGLIVAD